MMRTQTNCKINYNISLTIFINSDDTEFYNKLWTKNELAFKILNAIEEVDFLYLKIDQLGNPSTTFEDMAKAMRVNS